MASRTTLKEAQEVKAAMESRHPGVEIRVIDKSGVARMGRAVAERGGFEIIEDGEIMVKVRETRFEIVEVRHCRDCGAEILTAAIGEIDLDECPICEEARKECQATKLSASIEANRRRVAEHAARDEWEEN